MRMATPWRDPKSGVYYIRKAVPHRLRPAIELPSGRKGATLWKVSMRTTSPHEAKRRWPKFLAEYELAKRKAEEVLNDPDRLASIAKAWVSQPPLPIQEDPEAPDRKTGVLNAVLSQIPRKLLVQAFGAEAVDRDETAARFKMGDALWNEAMEVRTLTDALEGWLKERQPAPKTELDWRTAVKRFGAKNDVARATQADIVKFKDQLADQGLAKGTVKKMLTALRSLFGYAAEQGWRKDNPTDGVKVREGKVTKQTRIAYGEDHLKIIFAGPVHAKGKRPRGGGGEAAYWLPILGLYTGARLEELGQLRKENVAKEQGVWRLEITDLEDEQSVKTEGSRRKVPLHPDIAEAFAGYVEKMSDGLLFPDLTPDVAGRITGNWSKWWSRYQREELGIKDKRLVFHSLRRTFKTLCEAAEVPERIHDALTGHSSKSVGRGYVDNNLNTLAKQVAKLRIPVRPLAKG